MTLVKSAPKKSFAQKTEFFDKIVFWLKHFLGALFKVICTFLKSVRKDGCFDARFDLFKEKKFSSLRRDNRLFWSLMWIRDPESFDPGSGIPDGKIRIRDKHPGSATLAQIL
jgi:hypothetical protein